MKDKWLYLGISTLTILLTNNFFFRLILFVFWLLFARFIFNKKTRKLFILFLSILIIFSIPFNSKNINKGYVTKIKDNYILVTHGFNSILIYSKDNDLTLNDFVEFSGLIVESNINSNFETSSFDNWLKSENIAFCLNPDYIKVIKPSISLQGYLFKQIKKYENNWISELLFGYGLNIDSDNNYLIIASSMHISCLFLILRKLLQKKYYPDTVLNICLNISFVLGLIFHFSFGYVKVFISLVLEKYIKDKRDRTGLFIYLLALFKPYNGLSYGFMIPCLIRLVNCFKVKRSPYISYFVITLVQLYLTGYVNIVSLLTFGIFRYITTFLYLLALLNCLLPFKIPLDNLVIEYIKILDSIKGIYLKNYIPCIVLVIGIIVLIRGLTKKKYLYILLSFLLINNYRNFFIPFYSVTFLDVGQGDCCVITLPYSNKALLIDTGGSNYKDIGSDIVLPYLRRNGISNVDIIITHYDTDHSKALESIMDKIKINHLYDQKQEEIIINKLVVYNPLMNDYLDDNENSIVSYFNINGYGFLFLADIKAPQEKDLVYNYQGLDVDVCKIAHHGSNSSTSDLLISNYRFKYAIVSAGNYNVYHHPHYNVVNRLNNYKIDILNTQKEGAIKFIIYKNNMYYLTSK